MLRIRLYNPPTPFRLARALRSLPPRHPLQQSPETPREALSQLAWAHLKAVGATPPPRGPRKLQ